MLIQDLNYIETVEENVEGGAIVESSFSAGGNLTFAKTGGAVYSQKTSFKAGWGHVNYYNEVDQAKGGLKLFSLSYKQNGLSGFFGAASGV
jgi:hypothetical protein